MTESDDPWLQVLDLYKAAVFQKNVEAFMAIYDEDVQVFDMWASWSLRGANAWRAMAVGWFSSVGDERVVVGANAVHTTRNSDLAIGHAILTYTALSAEGKELRSLNNRVTAGLKRSGGCWKIVHQHTSAPVDFKSMKAILRCDAKDDRA
jgi:ketosteroid isomerase-like protein